MDQGTDRGTDPGEDGVWLTYVELAASRQIDRHSAVKLVLKRGWRRQRDNHGALRALVPKDWITPRSKGMPPTMARGMPQGMDQGMPQGTDLSRAINVFEGALTALREQLQRAEQGRDRAEAQAAELHERIEALQAQLAQAQATVQRVQVLEAADDARRAMGRWARLRAAWRGW